MMNRLCATAVVFFILAVPVALVFAQEEPSPQPTAVETVQETVTLRPPDVVAVVVYIIIIGFLGYLGFRHSRTAEGYLIAGRNTHPVIMALSYGATFISTSAIIGFSGMAGKVGLSILWLVFLNIFVGIFLAFVVFGDPTRRMGRCLGAHTFPELLGKRYDSRFIQTVAGLVIFLLMPMYAAATLLGGVKFLSVQFNMDISTGILIFAVIVAVYVIFGGLKGVMYTDAFQGALMFVGMLIMIYYGYTAAGGFFNAHGFLSDLAVEVPDAARAQGVVGYTVMPAFGSSVWYLLITSLTLGVGIGVIAQPQLAVRFMTVRSKKELNRAVGIGGLFILIVTGGAYVVGALSNVYFHNKYRALATEYVAGGDIERILPTFIKEAMPPWFPLLFFLVLLSAAMSTLSSQFHTMGSALGRDIYERGVRRKVAADVWTRLVAQAGVAVGIVVTVVIAFKYADVKGGVIAKSTALFFAICASTFMPSYLLGLFWRRMNRPAAIASVCFGFVFTAFWLAFMQASTASALNLSRIFGAAPLLSPSSPLASIDVIVFALPASFLVAILTALATKPMSSDHLKNCFDADEVP